MRTLFFALSILLVSSGSATAARRQLDLPVRAAGAGSRVPAPAYAGDVIEIQLAPQVVRTAWVSDGAHAPRARLGVPELDRAATELGARFTPLFHGVQPKASDTSGPDLASFYVVHLAPGVDLQDALERFAGLPEVLRADPIAILPVSLVPNDSVWSSSSWYFQPSRRDIHAPEAWDVTTGDTSVVVGIIDTGVLPYHPDLGGRVPGLPGQIYTNWIEAAGAPGVDDDLNGYVDDLHGWDFVDLPSAFDVEPQEDWRDEDNDPNGFSAHGTVVAGLVGALSNNTIGVTGTNWNVRLMPLRAGWAFLGGGLLGGEVRMDFVASAIQYAALMGVDVVNCSFANVNDSGLDAAVDAATAAGVTVVTSAGNNNQANYMATRRDVISVASVSSDDVLSAFSNRGPQVDLAAPGENITSTGLETRPASTDSIALRQGAYMSFLNGTSLSAPLVAGVAALIQARQRQLGRSRLDPFGVQLRLFDTADDIRSQNPGRDGQYGSGRLDAARAVTETWGSQALRLSGKIVGAPAVFRLANGTTRVAIACDDRTLVVYDGASLDTVWKATLPFGPVSGVTVGPLPGQGMGIFVGLTSGRVAGYLDDGSVLPGWPKSGGSTPMRSGVVVWDIDGDGPPEIVAGSDDGRVWAWHVNGDPVSGFPASVALGFRLMPLAVSHQQPARIAVSAEDGSFTLLDATGNVLFEPVTYPAVASPPVFAMVAGVPAVVVAENVTLHALEFDGAERPGFPVTLAAPLPARAEVSVGDVDQNGVDDFVLPGTSPARIEVRDSTGASLNGLGWPATPSSSPIGSIVLGHLTGGGAPELMVPTTNGLGGFSNDAATLWGFPKPGGGGTFPTLIDLDGDGTTEVLAGSSLDRLLFSYDAGTGSASATPQPWPTYRGDFQRTGSARDRLDIPKVDVVGPAMVTDLVVSRIGANSVRLRWTATGDDGATGRARAYDVRDSTIAIDAANFSAATHVSGPVPAPPGAADSLDIVGLVEGLTHYFALRVLDDGGNAGPVSNVVSVSLEIVSPAAVTNLSVTAVTDTSVTLSWTATGASGNVGRPLLYLVRAGTSPLTEANFNQAPYSRSVPATVDAGGGETYVFKFLTPATRYWFGLKAYNAQGYPSPLSNVVDAQTRVGGPIRSKLGIALAPGTNPSRVPALLYWQGAPGATNTLQEIRIFDLTGRRLRTIRLGSEVGGVVAWDGNDDDGRRVPAGLYLLRLSSGPSRVQARIVLLP